jgi:hypothetical protein
MEHIKMVNDTIDLCHDTDDVCWYYQQYAEGGSVLQSQSFATEELALEAWDNGDIEWA